MHAQDLVCSDCGARYQLGILYHCEFCGNSLEVTYDYSRVDRKALEEKLRSGMSFWDAKQLLPVRNVSNIITLGEGNTPLIKSENIGPSLKVTLFLKDETRNPTGSFKDRPNSVGISVAREAGIGSVAIASTGNGGGSLAAYAAKAGMRCYVFIPQYTSVGKVAQAIVHGAKLVKVMGHYSNPYKLALEACRVYGWANMTSTYLNPYTVEGDKTIAYELFVQLKSVVPDWIVVPLGAGAMLSGIFKGYRELLHLGFVDKLPKMIGVQAEGCSPITGAFERGEETVAAYENPKTVAGGICDPLDGYPLDGTRTLNTIRQSGGAGVSVDDELIMRYLYEIARKEAVFCEPASAAAVAAVDKLIRKGVISQGDSVVSIITGHGLKDTDVIPEDEQHPIIHADLNEFQTIYQIH